MEKENENLLKKIRALQENLRSNFGKVYEDPASPNPVREIYFSNFLTSPPLAGFWYKFFVYEGFTDPCENGHLFYAFLNKTGLHYAPKKSKFYQNTVFT